MSYSSDEDDKPIVFKRSSNSDKLKRSHQQKSAADIKPSDKLKHSPQRKESPSKPAAEPKTLNMMFGDISDDDELLDSKIWKPPSTGLNKRPRSSLQSSVKKPKHSDSSRPIDLKRASMKLYAKPASVGPSSAALFVVGGMSSDYRPREDLTEVWVDAGGGEHPVGIMTLKLLQAISKQYPKTLSETRKNYKSVFSFRMILHNFLNFVFRLLRVKAESVVKDQGLICLLSDGLDDLIQMGFQHTNWLQERVECLQKIYTYHTCGTKYRENLDNLAGAESKVALVEKRSFELGLELRELSTRKLALNKKVRSFKLLVTGAKTMQERARVARNCMLRLQVGGLGP